MDAHPLSIPRLLLSINTTPACVSIVPPMKTKQAVQLRRRFRRCFGWTLVVSVAVVELSLLGQFVSDLRMSAGSTAGPAAWPHTEVFMAIR